MATDATADRRLRLERRIDGMFPARAARYRSQLLYLIVGAWNTVFGYAVWALLQYAFGDYVSYLLLIVVSYPFAIGMAYLGYRYIVFRSRCRPLTELPRFLLVYGLTLAANLVALPALLHVLPWNVYVVQALFTLLVVIASYLGHRFFSFRESGTAPPREVPCDNDAERL